jgi:hypothetical protein
MTKASDISIQLYATPRELLEFVRQLLAEQIAYASTTENKPFSVTLLDSSNLDVAFGGPGTRRIYLTVNKPEQSFSKDEFDAVVSNSLILDVGHIDKSGLHQSWFACRVFDERIFKIWKQVSKRLKNLTQEGITATNRDNGVSQYYKSFRHTEGARKLQEQGVEIIPVQGMKGPKMRLGK